MTFQCHAYGQGFRALLRASIAIAFAHQAFRGLYLEAVAEKLGETPETITGWMMVPEDQSIAHLGELCWAMDCTPFIEDRDGHFVIEIRPNPTPTTEGGR